MALAAYIAIIPQSITVVINGASMIKSNVLPSSGISAQGLFLSFIVGIASIELLTKLTNFKRLKIKMPDAVPEGIARSFNSLIPVMLTALIITTAGFIFRGITGSYISDFIYAIIQKPLLDIAQTPYALVALRFVSQLFWVCGVHGGMAAAAVSQPIFIASLAENIKAVNSGLAAVNITTAGTFVSFSAIGGAGNTLALIIAILWFSKREDYREISKLALIPGLFGINEPLLFGLPIIFNPYFSIPFIVGPCLTVGIGYLAQAVGFIPCATVNATLGFPVFLRPFIYFGGSFRAAILQLVLLILSIAIYAPFVMLANRELKMKNQIETENK